MSRATPRLKLPSAGRYTNRKRGERLSADIPWLRDAKSFANGADHVQEQIKTLFRGIWPQCRISLILGGASVGADLDHFVLSGGGQSGSPIPLEWFSHHERHI